MTSKRRENYLVFGAPRIDQAELDEVAACLRSGWLGTGPRVARFETDFGKFIGSKYALAVNSCTAALHLSMLAIGVGPGDEVISTPLTFCATINAIIHTGATPVLVDCDREFGLIDPARVAAAVTPRTKAILPVHLYGRPCEMDAILAISARHGLRVVEDAAHAIEAIYKGVRVGTLGDLGCFSFYVTKNVTTGEGGMVTTNDRGLAETIKVSALHGMSKDAWKRFTDDGYRHYQVVTAGFKYNMMDLQAAIGIHQLARITENLARRNEIWQAYNHAFADLPVGLPAADDPEVTHARHLYTLLVDRDRCGVSRDEFMRRMHESGIGTGVHYRGVHLHPFYQERLGYDHRSFPNATWISERTVSIPLSAGLTEVDVDDVIAAVRMALEG